MGQCQDEMRLSIMCNGAYSSGRQGCHHVTHVRTTAVHVYVHHNIDRQEVFSSTEWPHCIANPHSQMKTQHRMPSVRGFAVGGVHLLGVAGTGNKSEFLKNGKKMIKSSLG